MIYGFQQLAARVLIRKDWHTHDQNMQEWICDEHDRQRMLVAERGFCERGCDSKNLIRHPHGYEICKWTFQPCPKSRLAALVSLYKGLNNFKNE